MQVLDSEVDAKDILKDALGVHVNTAVPASGVAMDSRATNPGDIFVAAPDALQYIPMALSQGAVLVLAEASQAELPELSDFGTAPIVPIQNARMAVAKLCQHMYAPVPNTLLAVTGTNGKSSTVVMVRQLLGHLGISAASLGTLGVGISGPTSEGVGISGPAFEGVSGPAFESVSGPAFESVSEPTFEHPPAAEDLSQENVNRILSNISVPSLTTYDPVSLHKILNKLSLAGVQCAAIEATSHGLHQRRLDGLSFDAVALTNITQDHLDYHNDMDAYIAAKMRLFAELARDGASAVIKAGCDARILDACAQKHLKIITYGVQYGSQDSSQNSQRGAQSSQYGSPPADLAITSYATNASSITFDLRVYDRIFERVTYHGSGLFQLENLLCALGLILGAHGALVLDDLVAAIPYLSPIPGRMELVGTHNGASIFVDFCHTPDAFVTVLSELKNIPHNNLVIVFGCGGDRDKTKRAQMGRIAVQLASRVIVTDDNPRFEDPASIRKDILEGTQGAGPDHRVTEIPGRRVAISQAIADLAKGDILLVAGRGHELYQKVMGNEILLSDRIYIQSTINTVNSQ
ncbi:MAG: UDP-N-acetylmuramoyl-L-alanyl-D-glutamate--2,6-diaminopimelate ligase [Holosporales bacterium]|jgi:UDP-N-acetylmuramoyl-L-alanyl-D-glutamate--2,6-diaminopimelate ligase|nr:UDP-N-acetylmuramoyl-L-alanyl-D-glutamate--2,6-diaminopimelate ligase [Holosporales bacterium]